MKPDIWVEVDLAALKHNAIQVQRALNPGVKLIAVVKANGYGHGYVEPAKAFLEAGAEMLAVTRLSEAEVLRAGGITAPILVLAPIQLANVDEAARLDVAVAVDNLDLINALGKLGKPIQVHLKVDTGMGRLGVLPARALELAQAIDRDPNLTLAGAFTHFARANEANLDITKVQLTTFKKVIQELRGINPGLLAHCANSAAALRLPESQLDAVRIGTAIYGQLPSTHVPKSLDLRPTWALKSTVIALRELPAGSDIGYGGEFRTKRPTKLAIVSAGFADGFTLAPEGPIYRQPVWKFFARQRSRRLTATVRGQRAAVVGRVSMQMTALDVTDIRDVELGDEVTLPALRLATSPAIPRIYR